MIIDFYIDDTGTKEKSDPKTDIFGYCGIAIPSDQTSKIIDAVNNLKRKYFNTIDVELKSKWFRLSDKREEYYLKPYNITEERFCEFSKNLFSELKRQKIRGLGSIVSKKGLHKKYSKVVFDASPVSYEILLQRMANMLTQFKADCNKIVFDDMSGKNSAGSDWKLLLIKQHQKLKLGLSPMYRTWKKRTKMDYSKIPSDIIFTDSRKDTLIQIADLFAYNIMRQGRDYRNFDPPELYTGYTWIKDRMHCDPKTKKITGYGAVFYP